MLKQELVNVLESSIKEIKDTGIISFNNAFILYYSGFNIDYNSNLMFVDEDSVSGWSDEYEPEYNVKVNEEGEKVLSLSSIERYINYLGFYNINIGIEGGNTKGIEFCDLYDDVEPLIKLLNDIKNMSEEEYLSIIDKYFQDETIEGYIKIDLFNYGEIDELDGIRYIYLDIIQMNENEIEDIVYYIVENELPYINGSINGELNIISINKIVSWYI